MTWRRPFRRATWTWGWCDLVWWLCVWGCACGAVRHMTKQGHQETNPEDRQPPVDKRCPETPGRTSLSARTEDGAPICNPTPPSHRQSENGRELRSTASARSKSPVRRYRAGGTSAAPWTSLWVSTSLIHRGGRLPLPTKRQRQGAADVTWMDIAYGRCRGAISARAGRLAGFS